MAFTIPDNDEALAANPQSIWMQTDIDALVAGDGGTGVISGGTVTAQGTPDMTVAVAAGEALVGTTLVTITSGNVTVSAANGTNPRVDLITVSNTGTKTHTAGAAAANPKAPAIPANHVLLAMVYVPANDTTIASDQIIDKRVILQRRLYTMHLNTGSINPVDATTVYFGAFVVEPQTTAALLPVPFQHYGRIIGAALKLIITGVTGSAETSTLSVRLNNTTDYQVSTAVVHNAASPAIIATSGLNVPIAPNDYIEMKLAYPTFATNPTGVIYAVTLLVEVYGA